MPKARRRKDSGFQTAITKSVFLYGNPNKEKLAVLKRIQLSFTALVNQDIKILEQEKSVFLQIVKNRKKVRVEPIIDGFSRFLFLDKKDMPEVALHWEKHFQWALGKYNRTHEEQMPKITPHVCRHTYCSNMAKAGMNPKALQYLMGHSDIGVTLNVYTHLGLIDAKEEMNRIAKLA